MKFCGLRATQLSAAGPSKYHYAAHMGQLIRGFEGGGCHHFFPACPFSAHDVRQIARQERGHRANYLEKMC